MPIFKCKVIDKYNKTNEFVREAVTEDSLIRELTKEDLIPIAIEISEKDLLKETKPKKYKKKSLIDFVNTILLLITSGLTLKDALDVAQTIFLKGEVNEIIVYLLEEIKKGSSFHEAVEKYKNSFPTIFSGFIKIGEKMGSMDNAFNRLSQYLTEEKKIKDKLVSALIYPLMVLGLAVIGIAVIVIVVLPKFKEIYEQIGIEPPENMFSIISILNISLSIIGIGVLIIIFLIPILILAKQKNSALEEKLDYLILKMPIAGKLILLKQNTNFIYAMENLLGSGYTVEDALLESSKVVTNKAYNSAILRAKERIEKGDNLSAAFLEEPVFSRRLGRWIAIGERSGHIENVFSQLRQYYQGEIDKWTTRFMELIQPAMILLIGIILLFMILFFIVPMFSVYGNML